MTYRWIITIDHIAEHDEPPCTYLNAVDLQGPDDCDETITDNPIKFRMYDDDGQLYYEGVLYGDHHGFEPLDDFGMANAGCTTVKLFENNKWSIL